ncbi:hypothetical protein KM043_005240 [Ampulex compressa]|nr:hypothetical protein KM043_005240 [Ampulex compressa]
MKFSFLEKQPTGGNFLLPAGALIEPFSLPLADLESSLKSGERNVARGAEKYSESANERELADNGVSTSKSGTRLPLFLDPLPSRRRSIDVIANPGHLFPAEQREVQRLFERIVRRKFSKEDRALGEGRENPVATRTLVGNNNIFPRGESIVGTNGSIRI